MGFLESLRSKYEIYRLEQRYTRRDKRTTFASGAVYVDGEYVYSTNSNSSASSPTSMSSEWGNAGSSSWGGKQAGAKVREVLSKGTRI